jgi:hypothetical protein
MRPSQHSARPKSSSGPRLRVTRSGPTTPKQFRSNRMGAAGHGSFRKRVAIALSLRAVAAGVRDGEARRPSPESNSAGPPSTVTDPLIPNPGRPLLITLSCPHCEQAMQALCGAGDGSGMAVRRAAVQLARGPTGQVEADLHRRAGAGCRGGRSAPRNWPDPTQPGSASRTHRASWHGRSRRDTTARGERT